MIERSALVVGSGVAGLAAAYWLRRFGFEPTIVERLPDLVSYGGVEELSGAGFHILEQMGLREELQRASLDIQEVRLVGASGKRRGGFDTRALASIAAGRYARVPRYALRSILLAAVAPYTRLRWGDEPTALEQRSNGVWVQFRHGASALFGVVVGADGLHSAVREQVFGEHARFERYLGLMIATFEGFGYPHRDEGVHVSYSVPGHQVARVALSGGRTAFRFVVADAAASGMALDRASPKAYVRQHFGRMGWEIPDIANALDESENVYFDRVSQVHLPRWARGAVALLGDAAFAPSQLSNEGSGLALVGAYVLAGELSHAVVPEGAFDRYQDVLRGLVREKQEAATRLTKSVASSSRLGIWLRSAATRSFAIPTIARAVLKRELTGDVALPNYPDVDVNASAT